MFNAIPRPIGWSDCPVTSRAPATPLTTRQSALLAVFTLSGFTGLIYESIWSHYLKLFLGHAAYAQTLVLAIFMGGMAIGAWAVGRIRCGFAGCCSRTQSSSLRSACSAWAFTRYFSRSWTGVSCRLSHRWARPAAYRRSSGRRARCSSCPSRSCWERPSRSSAAASSGWLRAAPASSWRSFISRTVSAPRSAFSSAASS